MNISFHAWEAYKECPKKYFLQYRKQAPATVSQNDYFKLYGLLVEKFFQMFSNIWRYKTPYMPPEFVRCKLQPLYEQILNTTVVDWNGRFVKLGRQDIFEEVYKDIWTIMDSPNQNLFLNTRSEITIEVDTQWGARLTGRLDFLHKNLDESELIIDGKGSKKIKKNVNEGQLLFYALLYYFHFKKIPDQLGFFYYRYNILAPVPFDINILNEFRAGISKDVRDIMNLGEFQATPCTRACKYCPYNNTCEERIKWQASHKKASPIKADVETGVVNLGF